MFNNTLLMFTYEHVQCNSIIDGDAHSIHGHIKTEVIYDTRTYIYIRTCIYTYTNIYRHTKYIYICTHIHTCHKIIRKGGNDTEYIYNIALQEHWFSTLTELC